MKQLSILCLCAIFTLALPKASFADNKSKKAKADAKRAKLKAEKAAKKAKSDAEKARKRAIEESARVGKKAKAEAAKKAKKAKANDPRRVAQRERQAQLRKARDLNGDGRVTKKEKRLANRSLSGQRETNAFFKRHDKNGDNKISVNEAPKGKKIGWFKRADKNKDNFLDRGEYFRHIRPGLINAERNRQRKEINRKAREEKNKQKKKSKAPKAGNLP